ncbi:GNAT family N-acetyltransferase [Inhella gelatinilytica]|uniref:GNAT family N-acetyltransferase n=1 Tax=Inhella gelatinilytica TaxID=2795030 RepID=A0A931IZS4_9BURK|nr:GNAT family protein [Inhella gelatinilytica]MBH9554129.1 GNAT family N-acetyltransferase [Inhella gelatinilytica]
MPDYRTLSLETPRLTLRPLQAGDAGALFGIHSDPRFTRFFSHAPWTQMAQAHELIERDQADLASGEHVRLGLVRRSDGVLLGTCTLFKIQPNNRRAELGYGLGVAHWGQGHAQEAVRALLSWGFGPLGLHRVEADIDPANESSAKLLRRLGFQLEGRLRERWIVDGVVSDSEIYGLLAPEWQTRNQQA